MIMVGQDDVLDKEAGVLNRIARWHPHKGITYAADPRHAEIIGRETDQAKPISTPAAKEMRRETEEEEEEEEKKWQDLNEHRSSGKLGCKMHDDEGEMRSPDEGVGANHLMTECPKEVLHSKVWRSAPACTRLCHCRQSRPSCNYQAEVRPSLYVWSTETKNRRHCRRRPEHISFALLELHRMCARHKRVVPHVRRHFVHGIQAHRPIHGPAFSWRHREREEREESVALHTLSSHHAVNDDI